MSIEELMQLRHSNAAPFDHEEYTVWLHNKIIDKIKYDLMKFREEKSMFIASSYTACHHIMELPSLKRIK